MSNLIHRLSNGKLQLDLSEVGAEIRSLKRLNQQDGPNPREGRELIWQRDAAIWGRSAPWLFPFVGKLKGGLYLHEGKRYDMPAHGFLRDQRFRVGERSERHILLELRENDSSLLLYPFRFRFLCRYELQDSALEIELSVENTDTKPLYFALGAHPGFQLPLEDGLSFEDYEIQFPQLKMTASLAKLFSEQEGESASIAGRIPPQGSDLPRSHESEALHCRESGLARFSEQDLARFTEEGLFIGWQDKIRLTEDFTLPLRHELFAHAAQFIHTAGSFVLLRSRKSREALVFSFPDFRHLGIWQPPASRAQFLCLEPWTSMPGRDDRLEVLSEKEDMLSLLSGEQRRFYLRIELLRL